MLKYKDEPRRFTLSFEEGRPPKICVRIFKTCAPLASALYARLRTVEEDYLVRWKFKRFEPDLAKGFGFDGAFETGIEDGEYFVAKAPLIRERDLTTAVSFGALFGVLEFLPEFSEQYLKITAPGDPKRQQFMLLRSAVSLEGNWMRAPLGGTLAPVFVRWIERVHESPPDLEQVEEAMLHAWNALSQYQIKKRKGPHSFMGLGCSLGEKGRLDLSTLGNACTLSTEDWWQLEDGEGLDLACHNLDTPIQQLSLLAGMAKLHDLADQDISKGSACA